MIALVFVSLVLLTKTLACPSGCVCNDNKTVRCRHAYLTELPSGLPSDTQVLDLSENKLSHFAPGAFGHLPELKALILSDNELTEVPVFDLRNQRLEKLTL
jgi:Leucine-rich repeat (LRR) protein